MSTVTQILDSIAEEAARADRTDSQLLDLFVRLRDQDAFAAVVRRHGPMVLGVCRRVLRNAADADDAFQAAFLVLARKAATISTRHLLAQWLYGVAYNTARKLRQSNMRRAVRECPLPEGTEPHTTAPEPRDDLLAILDEELTQLPERYRTVIVLCDLEGVTRREAARLLDCPEGTVGGRLARARALLAERLTRRGVVSAAAVLGAVFAERVAVAIPLAGVVRAVGVDDLAGAAAQGLISARVAGTTEGVLKSMFASKLRTIAATVLCCGLALACGFGAIHFANAQPKSEPKGGANPLAPPATKLADADAEKKLSLIPLKKLDAAPTIARLWTLFPKTVTVAAVRDENALIVYATAKDTDDVRLVLRTLGEELPKEAATPGAEPKRYTFRFGNTNWDEVLEWYAQESGLTLVTAVKPKGTVTIGSLQERRYTFADITDLYNEVLAQQKLILIRREKTFFLHPTDEKLPPTAWRQVELKNLPELGRTELVEVQITLKGLDAGDLKDELRKLLTPFGEIVFTKGKTLVVRDTVGNIVRILKTIEPLDKPAERPASVDPTDPRKPVDPEPVLKTIPLKKLKAATVASEVVKAFAGEKMQVIPVTVQDAIMVLASSEVHDRIAKFVRDMEEKEPEPPAAAPKTYLVRFDKAPWKDVFAWYAKETGLTRVGEANPTGTFTFNVPPPNVLEVRSPMYTLGELTDHINGALLKQKWLLIRNETSFTVVPADEKVDQSLVPRIALRELDGRGKTELVEVVISMTQWGPDFRPLVPTADVLPTVRRMVGPFGHAKPHYYTGSRDEALLVQDVAGNIRKIVKAVRDIEEAEVKKRAEQRK